MKRIGTLIHIYADAISEIEQQYNDLTILFKDLMEKYQLETNITIKNNIRNEMIQCKKHILECKSKKKSIINLLYKII